MHKLLTSPRAIIIFVALIVLTSSIYSASVEQDVNFVTGTGFDDAVNAVAVQPDGKLVVVGNFNYAVGVGSRRLVRLSADGTVDTSFDAGAGANFPIAVVRIQSDGKILLGGGFTVFNGTSTGRLIRLNPNGSVDASFNIGTGANTNSVVSSITILPGGTILVGGSFSSFNGVAANGLIRLQNDGTPDPTFTAAPEISLFGGGGSIKCISPQADGSLMIGGNFAMVNGNNGIARLTANGSWDQAFFASIGSGEVDSIAPSGNLFYIGGTFNSVNGFTRKGIARLALSGAVDTTFITSNSSSISTIILNNDGTLTIGGTTLGQENLLRLKADGSTDPAFSPHVLEPVNSVNVAADGRITIGGKFGAFTGIGGASPTGVRRFLADGSRDDSLVVRNGAPDVAPINIAVEADGRILLLGGIASVGGFPHPRFARLNYDGTVDNGFTPPGTDFTAIATQSDGKIIVGGYRFNVTGTYSVYRLNVDGSIDSTFNATTTNTQSTDSNVSDIAVEPDGKIIIAGGFDTVNGEARKSIARLNVDGSVDHTFTPGFTFDQATIYRVITPRNGKIYVAVRLIGVNTFEALFRLDGNGVVESFTQVGPSSIPHLIRDIAIQNTGKMLIAGLFTQVGGFNIRGVARIGLDGGIDATFLPPINAAANALIIERDGKIFVGGGAFTIAGTTHVGIIRLSPEGQYDPSFNLEANTGGTELFAREPDGKIILTGGFTVFGGVTRNCITRLRDSSAAPSVDFDGDGKTDISIFRPVGASGGAEWWYLRSSDGQAHAGQFGTSTDQIVAADFTGDGKTDIAVWRPSTGQWFIVRSEDGSFYAFPFGAAGDIPMPADYDGDGKADAAVFRPSSATWFILRSSDGQVSFTGFGAPGDQPVSADYDGDGKADIGVFRPNGASGGAEWWIQRSTLGTLALQFGASTDKAVPGDYTGDGRTDIAFFRPSDGQWFVLRSEDFSYFAFPFGTAGDIPVPGDYDGDGKWDAAVFRPSASTWFVNRSSGGTTIQQFATPTDVPVASAFVR